MATVAAAAATGHKSQGDFNGKAKHNRSSTSTAGNYGIGDRARMSERLGELLFEDTYF
jgi:hypothetical protein